MQEYKYIVWVGGVSVYVGNIYDRAREHYNTWVEDVESHTNNLMNSEDVILEVIDEVCI